VITLVLEPQDDGAYKVAYEWKTFRFLLNDGSTIDVRAIRDDGDLRAAVLATSGAMKIEGVALLKEPEPVAEVKRTPSKRPAKTA
jgi:RNase P/RNase MRP subunit p29